jgi:phage terminase Nu1 subunit (DNA packaging protein)
MQKLLTRKQVAELLNVTPHTLACWRSRGVGPEMKKFGSGRSAACRYEQHAVDRWLADRDRAEAEAREPWRAARRQAAAEQAEAAKTRQACGRRSKKRPRRARARV